jgi:hypothetical protein
MDTYISEHNRASKYRSQFDNLVDYISNKLDMNCAGENQAEVEELAADGKNYPSLLMLNLNFQMLSKSSAPKEKSKSE